MVHIVVSGTPGTGKTAISKAISREFGFDYVAISEIIAKKSFKAAFDKEKGSLLIDTTLLKKALIALVKTHISLVIDGHMSHLLPSKYADLCIMTSCELDVLKQRLEKRGYSPSKVKENLDSEIFKICQTEAETEGHKLLLLDTTHSSESELIAQIKKDLMSRNVLVLKDKRTCP